MGLVVHARSVSIFYARDLFALLRFGRADKYESITIRKKRFSGKEKRKLKKINGFNL